MGHLQKGAHTRVTRRRAVVGATVAATALSALGAVTLPPADAEFADPSTSQGRYTEVIDWVQWGNQNNEVVLEGPASSKTVTSVRTIGPSTLRTSCTVKGLSWEQPQQTGANGANTGVVLTPPLVAYAPGSWAGDSLDDLYNVGGAGYAQGAYPQYPQDFRNPNSMVIGLGNPNPGLEGAPLTVTEDQTDGARMSFDFSCRATLDGAPFPLEGIVFADAEASSGRNYSNPNPKNGPEWVQATAAEPGSAWRLLEQQRTCTQAYSQASWPSANTLRMGTEGQECALQNGFVWPYPDPQGHGPNAVAFLENDADRDTVSARVEIQGRGYSAIALGYVLGADFGDAPESYDRAGALLQPTWRGGEIPAWATTNLSTAQQSSLLLPRRTLLGETVDAERQLQHSPGADGDDLATTQDEDGLDGSSLEGRRLPADVLTRDTYSLDDVPCYGPDTGNAYVSGWIDWNGNGTFDPDERSSTATCSSGGPHRVTLQWDVPADANPGMSHTFVRLRIAEDRDQAEQPTGFSLTGEVEDHRIDLAARVQVDKTWVVDGQEYDHGTQPPGLDASPTLAPSHGTPEWGRWQDGYRPQDTLEIGEATDIDESLTGCRLTRSTLTGDGVAAEGVDLRRGGATATVTLPGSSNRYRITNTVECEQRLTLVKEVEFGERQPEDWSLSATGPADALPGHQDEETGTTLPVSAGVPYALSEAGPSEYVATADGWQCLDTRTGDAVETTKGAVTLRRGQDVTCTVTNTTAKLTLLKSVEGGDAAPQDWTLSAAPARNDLGLNLRSTPGSSDPEEAETWEVRPDQAYVLAEEPTAAVAQDAYQLDRVEMSLDGGRTWQRVEDPEEAITVPAGTHALYRFVNQRTPSMSVPLTGGTGRDAYLVAGVAALLAAVALGLWRRSRTACDD